MKSFLIKVKNKIYYLTKEGIRKERYNTYNNFELWQKDLYIVANKWLKKMPVIPVTETFKHPILANIFKVKHNSTIQSWQVAALIEGIEYYDKNINLEDIINEYIDDTGNWKNEPNSIDFGLLAYTFMKYYNDINKIKPAMKYMYEYIAGCTMIDGTVCYRKNMPEYRLVDTLGFICPFLVMYGKKFNNNNAIDLAYKQINEYIKYGLGKNGIPFHAYNIVSKEHLGANAWSRGIAWYILGLESFKNDLHYQNIMISLADSLIRFQQNEGGFHWLVNLSGECETSGTSVIGNLFFDCFEFTGNEKYRKAAKKCVKSLMKSTNSSGVVHFAQGDTKSIGLYSQEFSLMPFAQGYSLKLISRIVKLED